MTHITRVAVVIGGWILLAGFFTLEVGSLPTSAMQWALLLAFGPIAYLAAAIVGDAAMARLSSVARRLRLGSVGRVVLLVLILVPIVALMAYAGQMNW